MNILLRRKHRRVWVILAIALPAILVVGTLVIPKHEISNAPSLLAVEAPVGTIIETVESAQFKWTIRQRGDADRQLELFIKQPVDHPSALVFLRREGEGEETITLGQIGPRGLYRMRFPAKTWSWTTFKIEIRDAVKSQGIEQQHFEL